LVSSHSNTHNCNFFILFCLNESHIVDVFGDMLIELLWQVSTGLLGLWIEARHYHCQRVYGLLFVVVQYPICVVPFTQSSITGFISFFFLSLFSLSLFSSLHTYTHTHSFVLLFWWIEKD
jgi:hypothetical protein